MRITACNLIYDKIIEAFTKNQLNTVVSGWGKDYLLSMIAIPLKKYAKVGATQRAIFICVGI